MNDYYVYAYLDPRTELPFYVGKGCKNRFEDHLKETLQNTTNRKKWAFIRGLRNKGLEPDVVILIQGLSEDDAYSEETRIIGQLGRKYVDEDGLLTNVSDDGTRPPRYRDLNSESKRRFHDSVSAALSGVPKSAEHRFKLSVANTGKKASTETREKMSMVFSGRPCSEHAKQVASRVHLGKVVSATTRLRQSISRLGKKRGPTPLWVKQKISEIKKRKFMETGHN